VPARQSNDIRAGQTVHFNAAGRDLDGRVARVSPTVDPVTRSVTVYVQVPNASGAIRGGTAANGRIVLRTVPDALVVPSGAIRQSATSSTSLVYRIQNQELEPVPVTTGVVDAGRALTQIASGLREGDMVVVGNVGTLGRGMKVTIIGPDAAPGAAPTAGR
jgi:membrane fusion protein, multidrug efflux system